VQKLESGCGLDGVANGVAEVEDRAPSALSLVGTTTSTLTRTAASMTFASVSAGTAAPACASSVSSRAASAMSPGLDHSAIPAAISRLGRESRKPRSATTARG